LGANRCSSNGLPHLTADEDYLYADEDLLQYELGYYLEEEEEREAQIRNDHQIAADYQVRTRSPVLPQKRPLRRTTGP